MSSLGLRSYADGDAPALAQVFHRAVTEGAAARYSETERRAWSPEPPSGPGWVERLATADTVVAERDGRIVGFMAIDLGRGYVDFTYVLPEEMGKGVSDALYAVIEGRARAAGLTALTTDASDIARSFFERQGWRTLARQAVERRGVVLHNWRMDKTLTRVEDRAA